MNDPSTSSGQALTACPPHHWVLPLADGSDWVEAVCKRCGETRSFAVTLEAMGLPNYEHTYGRASAAEGKAEDTLQ